MIYEKRTEITEEFFYPLQSLWYSIYSDRGSNRSRSSHQSHEFITATKERIDYQWNPGDEGTSEPQHCQLSRQLLGGGGIMGKSA